MTCTLETFKKLSVKQRESLKYSGGGQCYICYMETSYSNFTDWVDNNMTATCPNCFSDTIISFSNLPSDSENRLELLKTVQVHENVNNNSHDCSQSEYESDASDGVTKTINVRKNTLTKPIVKKPGRNDPCLCLSGKKYKKCCGTV